MSTWNCRIVHYNDGGYGVHEVHYTPEGKIDSWTAAPSLALLADEPALIREQVIAMLDAALAAPVLEEKMLPGWDPQ